MTHPGLDEHIRRERGCTHAPALILAMGPMVRQGGGEAFGPLAPPRPGETPWFINSCQAWREGGPLHRPWSTRHPGEAAGRTAEEDD